MPVPERVEIGPYYYRVLVDAAALAAARVRHEDTNLIGEHDARRQEIALDPDLGTDMLAEVLLHEVLHAIWHAAGGPRGKVTQERAIGVLSPGLLAALRRNSALVAYLCGEE